MRYLLLACLCFLSAFPTLGQEELRYEQFLDWVKFYHPVAKQADINLEFGEQEMRIARGGFDPLLFGNYDNKQFKDTEYYDQIEGVI